MNANVMRALYAPAPNARLAMLADAGERLADALHRLSLHPTRTEAGTLQSQASAIARELGALTAEIEGGRSDGT